MFCWIIFLYAVFLSSSTYFLLHFGTFVFNPIQIFSFFSCFFLLSVVSLFAVFFIFMFNFQIFMLAISFSISAHAIYPYKKKYFLFFSSLFFLKNEICFTLSHMWMFQCDIYIYVYLLNSFSLCRCCRSCWFSFVVVVVALCLNVCVNRRVTQYAKKKTSLMWKLYNWLCLYHVAICILCEI